MTLAPGLVVLIVCIEGDGSWVSDGKGAWPFTGSCHLKDGTGALFAGFLDKLGEIGAWLEIGVWWWLDRFSASSCKLGSIRRGNCIGGAMGPRGGDPKEKVWTFEPFRERSKFSIVAATRVASAWCNLLVGPYVWPISPKMSRGNSISLSISCFVVSFFFSQRLYRIVKLASTIVDTLCGNYYRVIIVRTWGWHSSCRKSRNLLIMASMFREASAQIARDSAKKAGDGDNRPILGCRISSLISLYLLC